MSNLIDKSTLVAEIERRIKEVSQIEKASYEVGLCDAYKNILSFLNTLEVKEVDLEKEVIDWWNDHYSVKGYTFEGYAGHYLENSTVIEIAKHFFELGLSVNNPTTAADRGTAEEIIINLKRVEQDYRIDLTREIEWLRNQVKEGV